MKGLLLSVLLCTAIISLDSKARKVRRKRDLRIKLTSPLTAEKPTRTTLKHARFKRDYDFDFEGKPGDYNSEAEDAEIKNLGKRRRKRDIAKEIVVKTVLHDDGYKRTSKQSDTRDTAEETDTDERNYRPLMAGDYFTVQELLPVTQKLIAKVYNPGKGKGIVSSASSPQKLAEKLFRAFFKTEKQIVSLEGTDISALDALQVLALSEDEVPRVYDQGPLSFGVAEDVVKDVLPSKPGQSNFKLLKKKLISDIVKFRKQRNIQQKASPKPNSVTRATKGNGCRWRYKCSDPDDIDTCELVIRCDKPKTVATTSRHREHNDDNEEEKFAAFRKMMQVTVIDEEVKKLHRERSGEKEEEKVAARFRKMMQISVIDEEVEKILEGRYLTMRAKKRATPEPHANLGDYFRYLNEKQYSTTQKASKMALDGRDNIYEKDYIGKLEDEVSEKIKIMKIDKSIRDEKQLEESQQNVIIKSPEHVTAPMH